MKANILYIGICVAAMAYTSCKPKIAKDQDLPAPAAADFTNYEYLDPSDVDRPNFVVYNNTTPGGFISSWDFGGTKKSQRFNDTAFFPFEGTYKVTLISASRGGHSVTTKDIYIPTTSPLAAAFSIDPVIDNYHFKVSVTTVGGVAQKYMFGNGETSTMAVDTIYLPWSGTWDITLSVTAQKGSSKFDSKVTKQVTVTSDDVNNPDLNDPVFLLLTGGLAAPNGKTWLLHNYNGVGPLEPSEFNGSAEVAWSKNASIAGNATWSDGAAGNEYTFNIKGYQFIPKNQKATVHYAAANALFGKSQAQYQDIALEDPNLKQAPFILKKDPSLFPPQKYSLHIANNSYLGYNQNRSSYEIVRIKEDTLYIRQKYNDIVTEDPSKDGGARYFTYVAKK